jgi:hypothetical protein
VRRIPGIAASIRNNVTAFDENGTLNQHGSSRGVWHDLR